MWDELTELKHEIYELDHVSPDAVSKTAGLREFNRRAASTIKLVFLEKEMLTFILLQWCAIAAGYLLWVQMIGWIPEEV